MLDILFALEHIAHVTISLKIVEPIDIISCRVTFYDTCPMFMNAANKIIGDANID